MALGQGLGKGWARVGQGLGKALSPPLGSGVRLGFDRRSSKGVAKIITADSQQLFADGS